MKNKKLLRTAAALLLIGVGVVSAGCSFEIEQPDWVTQALCDHVFDEEVLEEVTCTEDGRVMKVCSDCGKTKIVTVKATGHDVVEDEAVDATCTTPGLTAGSHCTACGEVLVKQEEVVGEHTYGAWTVDVAATCTTEGQQKRVCSVCGETETEAISSAAHVDAANDGTCDTCSGSMFENATFEAVAKGDVLVGWYRIGIPELKWNEQGNPANMQTGTLTMGTEKLRASSNTVTFYDGTMMFDLDNTNPELFRGNQDYVVEGDSDVEDGWYVWTLGQTFNPFNAIRGVGDYTFVYFSESFEVTYTIGEDTNNQTQQKTVTVSGFTFDSCTFSFEKVVF